MPLARSGLAVAAGFVVFSVLFTLLGPGLGAVLTTIGAGVMAGYLTAKLAPTRELAHAGATAGLVAASLIAQPVFALPARLFVAGLAAAGITAGAWVRSRARAGQADHIQNGNQPASSSPDARAGGEERS